MNQSEGGREQRVSRAFVALADTLFDDYDVIDLLDRLVGFSVELLAAEHEAFDRLRRYGRGETCAWPTSPATSRATGLDPAAVVDAEPARIRGPACRTRRQRMQETVPSRPPGMSGSSCPACCA